MRIDTLHLKNFKCFADIDFQFHPQANVLLGVNGVGKTSILEGLRVAIGSLFLGMDKYDNKIESPGIISDDIRLANLEQQFPAEVRAEGELYYNIDGVAESELKTWKRAIETRGGKTLYKEAKDILTYSKRIQQLVRDGVNVNLPIVAYFSTERYKKERRDSKVEPNGSRLRGYFNTMNTTTNFKFFSDIYYTETLSQLQTGQKSELLSVVNEVAKKCIKCEGIEYLVKEQELTMLYSDGQRIPFHLLSDGVRSTLALVMEIAFRCYLLNPHLKQSAHRETSGVVLIDEIDLHLHPAWQKHILTDLCSAFPKIQFVVSTHAPLIVSSLRQGKIFNISENKVYDFPLQTGRDANYILEQMEVPSMDANLKNKIIEYSSMIEAGNGETEEAQLLFKELEDILGENHPELQRTHLLKEFFSQL